MGAPRFTPGPWADRNEAALLNGMPCRGISADAGSHYPTIAYVVGWDEPETIANAHLIAAAPTMKDALELALRLVEEALPKFDWSKSALDGNAIQLLNEAPIKIRAAISLAEGRPQPTGGEG